MISKTTLAFAVTLATAGMVLGHSGVKNAAVKARMDGMGAIADQTKILGGMAKGALPFDPAKAQAAARAITAEAGRIPALFEAAESDPKSEALPVIWENWDDFQAKADGLARAAEAMDGVGTLEALRAAMPGLGQSCKACHRDYRIAK